MPFDRAKTSLAFVEDRFRRLFGLAGTIDASFAPEIRPVVVTADLRDPGVSSFRGRHFAWTTDLLAPLVGQCVAVQPFVPVIIESLVVAGLPASARAEAYYLSPGQMVGSALPVPARTGAGTFIDNKLVEFDYAPITDTAALAAAGGGAAQLNYTDRVATWNTSATGIYSETRELHGLHLPATGAIYFFFPTAGGTNVTCACYGRIF